MSQSAASPLAPMIWGRHRLDWGQRTYIMGILNVTPDSFSRDGLAPEGADRERVVAAAVEQAQRMVADGADMLDIGGESTRPVTEGALPLPEEIERARVIPVIQALTATLPPEIILSIDTYKAGVAARRAGCWRHARQRHLGLARRSWHGASCRRAWRPGHPDEQRTRPATPRSPE